MKKCLIYSRVSSLAQDYGQQTKELYKEAYNLSYFDDDILLLEAKESAIKNGFNERESLKKLVKCLDEYPIEVVICRELSRLARRPEVLYELRNLFVERRIQLICCNPYMRLLDKDGKLDQTAIIMFSLFTSLSESEMMIKKERMREGKMKNEAAGKTSGGRPPFGYQINKEKRFELKYPECDVVKQMFERYANGEASMYSLAVELKRDGWFKDITMCTLRKNILYWISQEYYCGNQKFPAITTKSVYDRCQEMRVKNTVNHPNDKYDGYLCKHLLYSKESGHILSQSGAKYAYVENYGNMRIQVNNIDPFVYDIAVQLHKRYIANPSLLMQENIDRGAKNANRLKVVEDKLDKNQEKIDRLEERIVLGNISEKRANELLDRLKDEKQQLELEHNEYLRIAQDILRQSQNVFFDMKYDYDKLSIQEKRDIIKKTVRQVLISRYTRTIQQAELYSAVNDEVFIANIDSYHHKYELAKITHTNTK